MIPRLLLIISIIVVAFACDTKKDFPDPTANYFLKYYGKEGNQQGVDMVVNTDGTIIICGNSKVEVAEGGTALNYGWQIYLAKADGKGQVIWEKTLGKFSDEKARDIELTSDGNIVLVGEVTVSEGNEDVILMTMNQDGVKIDSVVFGVQPGLDDEAVSVSELGDGFIVCGSKANAAGADARDAIQVRFTKSLLPYPNWSNSYSQGTLDVAIKAFPRSINNTLIFGYTNGSNANDPNRSVNYWVYDLNEVGNPGKSQNLIGSPLQNELAGSVIASPALAGGLGYLISGITADTNGNTNIYIIKHDQAPVFLQSDVQFERRFEDNLGDITFSPDVVGNRVFAAPAILGGTGFLLLTNRRNEAGFTDMYLTKIDTRGQRIWESPVILGGEADDRAGAVTELSDARILVCGTIKVGGLDGQDKIVLLKLNANGRLTD